MVLLPAIVLGVAISAPFSPSWAASTVFGTITNGILLDDGNSGYPAPLTLINTGYINAGTNLYRGAAVYGSLSGSTLRVTNNGRIKIGAAGNGIDFAAGTSATLTNNGTDGGAVETSCLI